MHLDKYVEEFHLNSGGEGQTGGDPDERALKALPGEVGRISYDECVNHLMNTLL